ncbi:molybdopterin converting factor subunit 1 [Paenibacillus brevis]|uniref:Molybdopterin converting factor subunit 1 n=1 Tax=Paenibacillus brevis TaxID=2841508 RepID=A0ABS6FTK4_9BACL|nr:molybdopterin converting factor subunit 1 [Paenibacillus brevis]
MRILCFAHLGEQIGSPTLELELGPMTVAAFVEEFRSRYPYARLDQVMIAVNEQFVEEDHLIEAKDTVALLPPVSGG